MARKHMLKLAVATPEVAADKAVATLKSISKGDWDHPGFSFTRYWWLGEGVREGIAPWVRRKLKPGDDPKFGHAARSEVLLPPSAPGDYASIDFLLQRFDDTLPPFESHAMVQAKITLDDSEPWHVGYERVRAFARDHFAGRFPVVLVAHIPGTAGLEGNGSHVHCIVLSRFLGVNGLGGACHVLCSDRGYAAALSAWQTYANIAEAAA